VLKTGITIDECVKGLKLREKRERERERERSVTEFCYSIIADECEIDYRYLESLGLRDSCHNR